MFRSFKKVFVHFIVPSTLILYGSAQATGPWGAVTNENIEGPGSGIDFVNGGRLVARFVYGNGQMKPYLHVYGEGGVLLTNAGMSADGQPIGLNYNHRGIFIGWNKVTSDLGVFDLWHMNTYGRNGGMMEVTGVKKLRGGDAAEAEVAIEWRGMRADGSGTSDVIIRETRRTVVSGLAHETTQVDIDFILSAERDVGLHGDLQHAGIHFRATHEMVSRKDEVRFMWEPDLPPGRGRVMSPDFKWCLMRFPVGERWYAALQMNFPENPVEELSWRDYGRFGFFFSRNIPRGEVLHLRYRFIIKETVAPLDEVGGSSQIRAWCDEEFNRYIKESNL